MQVWHAVIFVTAYLEVSFTTWNRMIGLS